jgi:hypothetical protein
LLLVGRRSVVHECRSNADQRLISSGTRIFCPKLVRPRQSKKPKTSVPRRSCNTNYKMESRRQPNHTRNRSQRPRMDKRSSTNNRILGTHKYPCDTPPRTPGGGNMQQKSKQCPHRRYMVLTCDRHSKRRNVRIWLRPR